MEYNSSIWEGFNPSEKLTSGMMDWMQQLQNTSVGHYEGDGENAMWVNSPLNQQSFSSPDGRYTFNAMRSGSSSPWSYGIKDAQNPNGPFGNGAYQYLADGTFSEDASKPGSGSRLGNFGSFMPAIFGAALGGLGMAGMLGTGAAGAGAAGAGAAAETAGGLGSTFGQGLGSWGAGTGGAGFGLAPAAEFGAATTGLGGSGMLGGAAAGLGEGLGAGLGSGFNFSPGIDFLGGLGDFSGGLTSGLEGSQYGQTFGGGGMGDVTGGQSFGLSSAGELGTIPASTFGGQAIGSAAPFDAATAGLGDILGKMKLSGKDAVSAVRSLINSNSGGQREMSLSQLAPFLMGANDSFQQDKAGEKMLDWMKQQQAKIDGLYSPGSAEYNSLWQEMSRKDAAAGRNSQLGPRSVDLGARIAGIKADNTSRMTTGLARAYSDALTQRANARSMPGVGAAMGAGGGGGGLDSIINMLGGRLLGGLGSSNAPSTLGSPWMGGSGYSTSLGDSGSNKDIWDMINGWL